MRLHQDKNGVNESTGQDLRWGLTARGIFQRKWGSSLEMAFSCSWAARGAGPRSGGPVGRECLAACGSACVGRTVRGRGSVQATERARFDFTRSFPSWRLDWGQEAAKRAAGRPAPEASAGGGRGALGLWAEAAAQVQGSDQAREGFRRPTRRALPFGSGPCARDTSEGSSRGFWGAGVALGPSFETGERRRERKP